MIEIKEIHPVNRGSLLATCDVHILPWKLTLHEVKIFQKGVNRWLGMPAKEFVNADGEKRYIELITFDSESVKNRFKDEIMKVIDRHLETNPEMKAEPLIKEMEMPF